jgi:hypothetical protein
MVAPVVSERLVDDGVDGREIVGDSIPVISIPSGAWPGVNGRVRSICMCQK